jgi:acetylornithine/succinyldiaminopimelate/putrescine aminotransferase
VSSEKSLFIPLISEYWYAFRDGTKTEELRLYGARWNENTCRIGRKAILSKGYGKAHRIPAIVADFHKRDARTFGSTTQANILRIFGTLDKPIAQIKFKDFDRTNYPIAEETPTAKE